MIDIYETTFNIIIELIFNINLITGLTFIYNLIKTNRDLDNKSFQVVTGILFAIISIIAMNYPLELQPGLQFDYRMILAMFSGIYGGPISASITVLFASIFRIYLGGIGTVVGVLVIIISGSIGIIIHKYYTNYERTIYDISNKLFMLLGSILASVLLILLLVLLPISLNESIQVVLILFIPLYLTYIPGTLFVGYLLKYTDLKVINEQKVRRLKQEREEMNFYTRVENEVRRRQVHTSLSSIAGGIAHDFNNILTVIQGNLELVRGQTNLELQKYIDNAISSSNRASELISKIQKLSPSPTDIETVTDISEIADEVMFSFNTVSNIEFNNGLSKKSYFVKGLSSDIYQIFLNLTSNAINSINEKLEKDKAYHPKISIKRYFKNDSFLIDKKPYNISEYNHNILFEDTGMGMSEEIKTKVFDPLFTTRRSSKGHGLGLAIVYSLMMNLNGNIHLNSELGKGTVFLLEFPKTTLLPELIQSRPIEISKTVFEDVNDIKVLIIDDNTDLLEIAFSILKRKGFDVNISKDGSDGLKMIESLSGNIDLILLDLIMPGISGAEVLKIIKSKYPKIKVFIMTGHSEIAHSELESADKFIKKPFNWDNLILDIQELRKK